MNDIVEKAETEASNLWQDIENFFDHLLGIAPAEQHDQLIAAKAGVHAVVGSTPPIASDPTVAADAASESSTSTTEAGAVSAGDSSGESTETSTETAA